MKTQTRRIALRLGITRRPPARMIAWGMGGIMLLSGIARADTNLVAWGENDYGQTAIPATTGGWKYVKANGGQYQTVALVSDGSLVSVGYPSFTNVPSGTSWIDVSAGFYHGLALRTNGQITAFGWNNYGEGTVPALPGGVTYTNLAAGQYYSLAVRTDGQIVGFGQATSGQTNAPALPGGINYTKVATCYQHSLALRSDGQVVGFGNNTYGQTNVPALSNGLTYTAIAVGQYHSLVLRSDGQVIAFGYNGNGQTSVPALTNGLTYTGIAAGYDHSALLRSDGRILAFGLNNYNQTNVPALPAGSIYTGVGAGYYATYGITAQYVSFTLLGSASINLLAGGGYTDAGATAVDLNGASLAVQTNGTVDVNTPGVYNIVYTAWDGSGHTNSVTRVVSVLSQAPPFYLSMMPSYSQQSSYGNAELNQPIEVWGRAWGGMGGTYDYAMDFGDGQTNSGHGISASQLAFYVGASHTYAASGSKTATLTVTDNLSGSNYSRQAVIRVMASPTHDNRVNMAIEKGKLYLYKNQIIWDTNRIYWFNATSDGGLGATAFALLAFEENGHLPFDDYQQDIYALTVQQGLNTIASQAVSRSMAGKGALDSNGDGIAITVGTDTYADCLSAAAMVMAFTSTNAAQSQVIPTGLGSFSGTNYYDFVVDMIDALYGSQHSDGAWHYSVNPVSPDSGADGSTHQWPNIVLLAASERWGMPLNTNVVAKSMTSFASLQNANGGCGYSSSSSSLNAGKTGGMLAGFTLGGKFVGDDNVNRGLQYVATNWNAAGIGWAGDAYAMYGVKKGLQLQGVTTLTAPDGAHDWYQDMSAWLLGDTNLLGANVATGYRSAASYLFGQNADGSWTGTSGYITSSGYGTAITTGDAILVLTKAVTKPLPVAGIAAVPDQSSRHPAAFTLDGSSSYHMDPNSSIVEYLWIWTATNNLDWTHPDATGRTVSVNPGWTNPGGYTVTLRVKDNANPANYATATKVINVLNTAVAPVAVAIPPSRLPAIYTCKVGATITLDGSASYSPDGDTITNYVWDLNGDGVYGDSADAALDTSGNAAHGVTATMLFNSSYNGQIGLKVTANGKSSSNVTTVDVYVSPSDLFVNSLSVASVTAGVSVQAHTVLTNDATSGQGFSGVLVKFFNGNPLTTGSQLGSNFTVNLPVGGAATIDTTLPITGLTNFDLYVFVDANNAIPEWNESNNIAAVTISAGGGNPPPVVNSPIPGQAGTYGTAFTFTFDAGAFTDGNGFTLAYTAANLPPGLSFNSATRTISGTPTNAGNYAVQIVASDGQSPAGLATNVFSLNVAPAALVVSVDSTNRVYGAANPALTGALGAVANGDSITATYATAADTNSPVGAYDIVPVWSDPNRKLTNYAITTNKGVLTITKALLTVTANSTNRIYGTNNPVFTLSYSGFLNGDTAAQLTTLPVAASTAAPGSPRGTNYTITVSGGASSNYTFAYVGGNLTVAKAPLLMVGNDASRAYGSTNPTFTATVTGVMNGDNITPSFSFSGTVDTNTPPGLYKIRLNVNDPDGLLGNYNSTNVSGYLTITNALLTGAVANQSRPYAQTNAPFSVVYSGFVNGQGTNLLTGALAFSCLDSNSVPVDSNTVVGVYDISVTSPQMAQYYTVAYQDGALTVTKPVLAVVAQDAARAYGQTNPTFSATITGFVMGQDASVLGGSLSLTCSAQTNSDVGTYAIVPSGLSSSTYTFSCTNGTLTVSPAPLVVTGSNTSRAYGASNPTLNGSLSGLTAGDAISAAFSSPATVTSPVGAYDILPAWQGSTNRLSNYAITTNKGALTITAAALTLTSSNTSRGYGQTNPVLAGSIGPVLNSDGLTASFSTAATPASPVGNYTIFAAITDPSGKLANYAVSTNLGALTIMPAALTVTAGSASRAYGQTNPPLAGTLSGVTNSDVLSVGFVTAATPASPVGSYTIVPLWNDPSKLANYLVQTNAGTLTVTQAVLTATADNQSRPYGQTNPPLTISYTGFANGDGMGRLTVLPVAATVATNNSWLGTYPITVSGGVASNYVFSCVGGTLTVGKAELVVTGDDASRAYGQTNPVFTAAMTGALPSDNITFELGTSADTNSPVGLYDISVFMYDPNDRMGAYNLNVISGTLTVTNALLTGQVASQTRGYGQTNAPFTVSYTGFANGQASNILTGAVTFTCVDASSVMVRTNTRVGAYAIHAAGQHGPNYSVVYADGTLTITQAVLGVTANGAARGYGQTNPVFSAGYNGFVNNETAAVLSGSPSLTCAATTNSPVGPYTILATNGTLSAINYAFNFANGTLSVTQAVLLVTADNQARAYGATNPALTASYAGYYNGDNATVLNGHPALSTSATTNSPAGPYTITVTNGTLSATNYAFSFANGTLTVSKASVAAVANNQARSYGVTNPSLSISYSGFANGETASVLGTPVTASTVATTNSPVGSYAITLSGGADSNYTVNLTNGTLTVTKAALLVTANDLSRGYGLTNPVFTAAYSGFLNADTSGSALSGQPNLTCSAATNSAVGPYPILATNGTLSATNYAFNFTNGTLTVTQAVLLVTANNQSRGYGATNPTLTASFSGFFNGDTTSVLTGQPGLSTSATTNSWAGTYPILVTNGTLSAANYAFGFSSGLLTVTQAVLQAQGTHQSRPYGATNPALIINYTGFVNNQDATVLHAPVTASTLATTNSPVGNYAITLAGGTDTNYTVLLTDGLLTVTKASLGVTANSVSRAYGATNPAFTANYMGFLNGDTASVLNGQPSLTTAATTNSVPGAYAIVVTNGTLSTTNYTFNYTNGTLTVTQATLIATANGQTRAYGTPNPALTIGYSGFVNGEGTNVLTTQVAAATAAVLNSPVGSYPITLSGGVGSNYAVTLNPGSLSITPASMTISANNAVRPYGATNPVFSGTINGIPLLSVAMVSVSSNLWAAPLLPGAAAQSLTMANLTNATVGQGLNQGGSAVVLGQTFRAPTNFTLGEIDIFGSVNASAGSPLPVTLNLYDVTGDGGLTNANPGYTPGNVNGGLNLLGAGSGLGYTFTNAVASAIFQFAFGASNQVMLQSNHVYAFEVQGTNTANFSWYRDTGQALQGNMDKATSTTNIVAGLTRTPVGGGVRTAAMAVYGANNSSAFSLAFSTPALTNSPAGSYAIVPSIVDPTGAWTNYTVVTNNGTLFITAGLTLTGSPGYYVITLPAVKVDTNASLADGGSVAFSGATLTMAIVTNATANDLLAVQNQGSGAGQIRVVGSSVTYGGLALATIGGGGGTNPLVLTLTANANSTNVTALLRQVVFYTSNTNTALRVLAATLNYGSYHISAARSLTLNRRPVAVDDIIYGTAFEVLTIPYSAVLANDYDVDGDPISVAASSLVSSAGGWVTGTNNTFVYEPPVDALTEDNFAYIADDGRGGQSAGVVYIHFLPENVITIDTSGLGANGAAISLAGMPGAVYAIEASTNLVNWAPLSTNTASGTGIIQVMDKQAKNLPKRFYRAVAQ